MIVQIFNDKKNTKSTTTCTVPIHVETHSVRKYSKIKCCDEYGKLLYYLLLIRISYILFKLAYLINKILYSSCKISYINKIFNILNKISYMIIKDNHLSNIRYIIYK